ncbi:MAG: NAD(+) synthase [Coriobacteriia bacterium]|nr:NAD(+) synthase [Coriobacteriia bacterium]MCL2537201.1 NAD(+) synthase [Coriobacteriia bacterium]
MTQDTDFSLVHEKALLHTPTLPKLGKNAGKVYDSIVKQTRQALKKTGFKEFMLGLSGGLDSAMVACILVDALAEDGIKPADIHGVMLPSQWTSQRSIDDALELADRLGISTMTVDITASYDALAASLAPAFEGTTPDITEENMQVRIRAVTLMALSNKFGWLVINTSNYSETSTGYSTLYGDTIGAFAPLAPLYKTWVYELAQYRNKSARLVGAIEPIPESILERAPSAELKEAQTDCAALGRYEHLDAMLYALEKRRVPAARGTAYSPSSAVAASEAMYDLGFDKDYSEAIVERVSKAAYKRKLAGPGATLPKRYIKKGGK